MDPNNDPYLSMFPPWFQVYYPPMLGTNPLAPLMYPSPNSTPTIPSVPSPNPTPTFPFIPLVPVPSIPTDWVSNATTPAPNSTSSALLNQAIEKRYPKLSIGTLHYTEKQSRRLFTLYQADHAPNEEKMTELAHNIGLTVRQVERWFGGKRARLAKAKRAGRLEIEVERLSKIHHKLQQRKRIRFAAKKAKSAANEDVRDMKTVDEFLLKLAEERALSETMGFAPVEGNNGEIVGGIASLESNEEEEDEEINIVD